MANVKEKFSAHCHYFTLDGNPHKVAFYLHGSFPQKSTQAHLLFVSLCENIIMNSRLFQTHELSNMGQS